MKSIFLILLFIAFPGLIWASQDTPVARILFRDSNGKTIREVPFTPYSDLDWQSSPMTKVEDSYHYDKVEMLAERHVLIAHAYKGYENAAVTSMTFYDPKGIQISKIEGGGGIYSSPDKKYIITYGWIEGSGDSFANVYSYKGKLLKKVDFKKETSSMNFEFENPNVVVFEVSFGDVSPTFVKVKLPSI